MKLTYYQGPRPNFGDDLNAWLWPRILPNYFDSDDRELFIGIGSILTDDSPAAARKIVVGSGYGGYSKPPVLDSTWEVKFVRGKHTAKRIGLDERLGIGDSAILIRGLLDYSSGVKKHKFSFMPHWESAQVGLWADVCKRCGFNYIDPRDDVESVNEAILRSEVVITEAMHGAIVSDALRTPWIAMSPIHTRHHAKWSDWSSALGFEVRFSRLTASGLLERVIETVGQQSYLGGKLQYHGHVLNRLNSNKFIDAAAKCLLAAAKTEPCLSADSRIASAHEQMLQHISALKLPR
jgi:hypothetical protein